MKLTGIAADNWEGEVCDNCDCPYDDDYRVPDEVWEQIHERAPAGLLCMECTEAKAKEIGISLAWDGYYIKRGEKVEDDKVISSYRIVDERMLLLKLVDERILLLKSQLTDLQQRHDDMTAWSITQEKLVDELKQKLITFRKEKEKLEKQALELHKAGTDMYEMCEEASKENERLKKRIQEWEQAAEQTRLLYGGVIMPAALSDQEKDPAVANHTTPHPAQKGEDDGS